LSRTVFRKPGAALKVTGVFLACLLVCLGGYALFGHRILAASYSDKSLPLGRYLAGVDEQVTLLAVTTFLSFFFYLFVVLIVRRLLRRDADAAYAMPTRSGVRLGEIVSAFLVYALLTIAYFPTVVLNLGSQLVGPPADNMQHLWDIWWARTALQGGLDFLHTTYIYWPGGVNLLFHPFSIYNVGLAATVGWPLSPVAAYNLLILLTFVLAGVGAFLLIRYFTDSTAAALLGGFVFAFSPTHFAHALQQIEIASLQFVPFFVLYYLRTLETGSKRSVVLASVFFLLNTLCSWYYLVFALFCMAGCYGIAAYRRKRLVLPGPIVSSLVIVGVTFVVVSPLAVRMLLYAARTPGVSTWGYDVYVVDLLGLVVPHSYHWLAGLHPIAELNGAYSGFRNESAGYLGIVLVGLLLASGRMLAKRAARYVLGLLSFVVLAFGADLHFAGWPIPVALPYAAIQYMPILSEARAPNRAMAYAYLFLGILVAVAFAHQLREGFLRNRTWVAALLALGICADFWTPCRQTTAVHLPPAYTAIAAQEKNRDFGILDLPRGTWSRRARYMMYQTLHGFPIVQGYISRKPSPSLIDTLEYDDLSLQSEQLRSAQVKYIVIHKRYLARDKGQWNELDMGRYAQEYQTVFEDTENLALRVY
jgi:hypothetical protein